MRDASKYENLNKCCVYLDVYGSALNVYLDVVKMLFADDEMVSVFPFVVFLTLVIVHKKKVFDVAYGNEKFREISISDEKKFCLFLKSGK